MSFNPFKNASENSTTVSTSFPNVLVPSVELLTSISHTGAKLTLIPYSFNTFAILFADIYAFSFYPVNPISFAEGSDSIIFFKFETSPPSSSTPINPGNFFKLLFILLIKLVS